MILKIVLNKAYRLVIDNEHRKYRLSAKDDGNVYFVIRRRRQEQQAFVRLYTQQWVDLRIVMKIDIYLMLIS